MHQGDAAHGEDKFTTISWILQAPFCLSLPPGTDIYSKVTSYLTRLATYPFATWSRRKQRYPRPLNRARSNWYYIAGYAVASSRRYFAMIQLHSSWCGYLHVNINAFSHGYKHIFT